jgi:hypothetical protein
MSDYYITPKVRKMWTELVHGKEVEILIDGSVVATVPNANEAFKYIHDHQGQSVPWACAYEGYSVRNVLTN